MTSNNVWFGVQAPQYGCDFDDMKRLAQEAERQGFDLFTILDHFINEFHPESPRNHPLECWTTLAGLAAVTSKIKLGPLVSCYAYRRPTVLAKMATTIDIISGGRLLFGIGAGSSGDWQVQEFKSFMGRFPPAGERVRGLRETVEICKSMFTRERTTYHGKLYKVDDALNSPQPIQKPVPIMVGGGGEKRTLRIAAEHADISHFGVSRIRDLEILEAKLSALRRHCMAVGRDYDSVRKGSACVIFIGHTEDEAKAKLKRFAVYAGMPPEALFRAAFVKCGTPDVVVDGIREFVDMGLGLLTCIFYSIKGVDERDINADVEDMRLFADEVIPQFV